MLKQPLSIYLGKVGDIRAGLEKLYLQEDFSGSNEVQLAGLSAIMNPPEVAGFLPVTDFSQVIGFNNPEEFLIAAELLQQKELHRKELRLKQEELKKKLKELLKLKDLRRKELTWLLTL